MGELLGGFGRALTLASTTDLRFKGKPLPRSVNGTLIAHWHHSLRPLFGIQ
jgi:hypothetical protein